MRKYVIVSLPEDYEWTRAGEYVEEVTVRTIKKVTRHPEMWFFAGVLGLWDVDEVFLGDDLIIGDGEDLVLIGIMEMI